MSEKKQITSSGISTHVALNRRIAIGSKTAVEIHEGKLDISIEGDKVYHLKIGVGNVDNIHVVMTQTAFDALQDKDNEVKSLKLSDLVRR